MPSQKLTHKDILLGKRIKKLRNKAGLTQEMLADKTRLSLTFIGLIETGKRKPSLKSLSKISSALHVKVNELLPY